MLKEPACSEWQITIATTALQKKRKKNQISKPLAVQMTLGGFFLYFKRNTSYKQQSYVRSGKGRCQYIFLTKVFKETDYKLGNGIL